ncbi:unnamed protein product [Orchesella dallaii]|uniref:Uncharacterized protein n=1 Tax=Orchesella dallaii TaxID=48710 RepID=A0ABP1QHG0_9HEXA
MLWYAVVIILIASPETLHGAPNGEAVPAALAAEPAAVLSSPTGPAVAAVPAAVAPAVATPAVAQDPAGNGIVTEHKNPDGSTITVTRYNGPIPASAFPNPYGGQGQGFFPFYGGYNQYNPFFPFAQPAARTVK